MNNRKVTVAGAGVLGAQIATQIAYSGYDVCVYEVEQGLDRAKGLLDHFHRVYAEKFVVKREKPEMHWRGIFESIDVTPEEIDEAETRLEDGIARMTITTSPEEAFSDAAIIIEAVPERTEVKTEFYKMIAPLVSDEVLILTNTSTLLPSTFAPLLRHPERFLAFHFLNAIWSANLVEVMPHQGGEGFPGTDPEAVEEAMEFGKSIHMIPVALKKEHACHVYNSMLNPWLSSALELYIEGVADYETIDYIWSIAGLRGSRPFKSMDSIGINTMFNTYDASPLSHDPENPAYRIREMLAKMIEEGRLGYNAGHGFYDYE